MTSTPRPGRPPDDPSARSFAREPRAGLDRLLGGDGARWLVERVRERVASGRAARDGVLSGVVARRHPTRAERETALRLVGPPRRPGDGLRVDLARVEEVLRRGPWPAGLVDAVETLTGPITVREQARAEADRAWAGVVDAMEPAIASHPALAGWWARFCADGGHKRLGDGETAAERAAAARQTVDRAASVLRALPLEPPGELLSVFARRVLGDAHGLDADRRVGRLVVAAIRGAGVGAGVGGSGRDGDHEGTAGGRETAADRDVWGSVGLAASTVTSTVLCLGVRGHDDPGRPEGRPDGRHGSGAVASATAASLEAMAGAVAPVVLTLEQVRSGGVRPVEGHGWVYVVENPTVVEAVATGWAALPEERRPPSSAPVVVCTNGQPTLAVVDLVTRLAADGAGVRYHGDFDWPGLRIATALGRAVRWTPWRFTSADYVAAAAGGSPARPLRGSPAESPWDPELATVMAAHGVVIEEEALIDELVADVLRRPPP